MTELIALSYSPWSEKARWALDHHGIRYREIPHLIMLGEPWLRLKTRRLTGKVSVPTLIDGDRIYCDSFEIARYADWFGSGAPLIGDRLEEVESWNRWSERGLAAGRVLATARTAGDARAKEENVPGFVPNALRPALRPLVTVGIAFLQRKYDYDHAQTAETHLEETLHRLREGLAGGEHLFGHFSYADVAMATVLDFVSPVANQYIHRGEASRRCWTHDRLASEYRDLVEWRDALYARHRRPG